MRRLSEAISVLVIASGLGCRTAEVSAIFPDREDGYTRVREAERQWLIRSDGALGTAASTALLEQVQREYLELLGSVEDEIERERLLVLQGSFLLRTPEAEAGERLLLQALALPAPRFEALAHHLLADAKFDQGRFDEASVHYEWLTTAGPAAMQGYSHYRRAYVLAYQGDCAGATDRLAKARTAWVDATETNLRMVERALHQGAIDLGAFFEPGLDKTSSGSLPPAELALIPSRPFPKDPQ